MPTTSRPEARRRRAAELALGLAVAVLLAASGAAAVRPSAAVEGRVQAEGHARVLVTLAAPGPPAPGTESIRAQWARRLAVAAVGDAVLRQVGAGPRHRVRAFTDLPLLALDAGPAELAALENAPEVLAIEEDAMLRASLADSVPMMGGDRTNAAGFDGSGVVVAVLDTGVDVSHPAFTGRVLEESCFSSTASCPNGQTTMVGPGAAAPCGWEPGCFHGTHVAGIVLANTTPHDGVARGASLVAVQVFSEVSGPTNCPSGGPDPCAVAFTSDVIAGMTHVASLGLPLAAVNLSLGHGPFSSQRTCDGQNASMKSAVDQLLALGIATVAAAGNAGDSNAIDAPACISSAIGVGVTRKNDSSWDVGNSSDLMDFWGTGVGIESAAPTQFYASGMVRASGTSMSAPHIAGALAVLRQVAPTITVSEMRSLLASTGKMITDARNGVTRARPNIDVAVASLAPGECFDGIDNDGDGDVDYPADPGCRDGLAIEGPACDDDLDNDGDGAIDWDGGPNGEPADPHCSSPLVSSEVSPPLSCGGGPELALLLPLLAALRRRGVSRR